MRGWSRVLGSVVLLSCGFWPPPPDQTASSSGTQGDSDTIAAPTSTSSTAADDGSTTIVGTTTPGTTDATHGTTIGTTASDETTTTGCDPNAPRECGGLGPTACSDGLDNDGDGLVDLGDPECLTPCDDTEDVFPFDWPRDFWDCPQDCGFDGGEGKGDDGCSWDLRCDPLAPAADTKASCTYQPGAACNEQPQVPASCVDFCVPFVPNGCDCFGCCTVDTDGGPIDVWLGTLGAASASSGCSTADPLACPPCTSQMELCGNPCEPEACEVCVGQLAPPLGCEAVGCVGATACEDHCDCGPDEYCLTGCCHPLPPS